MATAFKPEEYTPEEHSNLPVERATIEQIEGNRRRALELYAEAFDKLQQAGECASNASISGELPGATYLSRENLHLLEPSGFKARDDRRERFLTGARQNLDRAIWKHLLLHMDLERLMDRKSHDDFRDQLEKDPPEATAENCFATMSTLMASADDIFRRGIANAFSSLDRRFKSHDGFKVGSRVVLSNAMGEYGMWNHYARHDETIRDVERTFYILDGKENPERSAGIIGLINEQRGAMERRAFVVKDAYFEVKVFKNGNVHLWFKRKDLLEKVNQLLAEYYGEVLGEGANSAQTEAKKSFALRPMESHARNFGFFPTSAETAERVLSLGDITHIDEDATILEPSAGDGALIKAVLNAGARRANITAVEIQHDLMSKLEALDIGRLMQANFLALDPADIGQFDIVLMNPPFDRGRDTDHVLHAMKFVKPGGKLIAIMAASAEFREDAKATEVRRVADVWSAIWHEPFRDLPDRSFAHAGTNVNTLVLSIRKPTG